MEGIAEISRLHHLMSAMILDLLRQGDNEVGHADMN